MAFANTWESLDPTDATWAYQVDDNIRGLRDRIDERLAQVIVGWPNTDPLKLDTTKLEPAVEAVEAGATIARGTEAALPNPAVTDFYWATDSNKFYVKEEGVDPAPDAFVEVVQGEEAVAGELPVKGAGSYDTSLADGAKMGSFMQNCRILTFRISATSNLVGLVTVDLNEFDESGNIYTIPTLLYAHLVVRSLPVDAIHAHIQSMNTTNNTITWQLLKEGDAGTAESFSFSGYVMMAFAPAA